MLFLSLTRNEISCHKSRVLPFLFSICSDVKVDGEASEAVFAQRLKEVLAAIAAIQQRKMIILFVREVQVSADGLVSDFGIYEHV